MIKEIKITKNILIQKQRELTEIEDQGKENSYLSNNLQTILNSLKQKLKVIQPAES